MLVVNNPGDPTHWWPTLAHAEWNGLTFADLVFPAFLVAVGASMAAGRPRGVASVVRRAAVLVALGVLLNGFPHYDVATWRWPGVLQRIGVCFLVAALVVRLVPRRAQWLVAIGLLVGYALVMHTAPLTPAANVGARVDRAVFHPAHLYRGGAVGYDPEGLLSTIPAAASVLVGHEAGWRLLERRRRDLVVIALVLLVGAVAWGHWFPVNKRLWSPSFVLVTGGVSLLVLAALDALPARRLQPLVVLGRNAIVAYVGSELVNKWLEPRVSGGRAGSLAYALATLALWWLVVTVLWRRRLLLRV